MSGAVFSEYWNGDESIGKTICGTSHECINTLAFLIYHISLFVDSGISRVGFLTKTFLVFSLGVNLKFPTYSIFWITRRNWATIPQYKVSSKVCDDLLTLANSILTLTINISNHQNQEK